MVSMVYRQKRTVAGNVETARMYRGRYPLDGATKITDVALNTTDKRIALQNLEKIMQVKQLEAARLIPSEIKHNAAQTPLLKHLKDYLADLTATGRDSEYVYIQEKQVQKLFKECRWSSLPDVTSDSFLSWRARQRKAPKTLNEYLASVSAVLNWMERHVLLFKLTIGMLQANYQIIHFL